MSVPRQKKVFRKKRKKQPEQQSFLGGDDTDSDMEIVARSRRSRSTCFNRLVGRRAAQTCVFLSVVSFVAWIILLAYVGFSKCGFFFVVEESCQTASCHVRSGDMLRVMNRSAERCSDFYTHSCGSWLSTYPKPPSQGGWTQFGRLDQLWVQRIKAVLDDRNSKLGPNTSEALTKMFRFHDVCLDIDKLEYSGFKPVLKFLKKFGYSNAIWLEPDASRNVQWDLVQAQVFAQRSGLSPFVSISVERDSKENKNVVQLRHGALTLGDEQQYWSEDEEKYRQAFLDYSTRLSALISGKPVDSFTDKLQQIYLLEQALAKAFQSKEYMMNETASYHKMTVDQVDRLFGNKLRLGQVLQAVTGLHSEQNLVLYVPDYALNVSRIAAATNEDTLAHFVLWRAIDSTVGYMPDSGRQAGLRLDRVLYGTKVLSVRWESCVRKTRSQFSFAVASRYLYGRFGSRERDQALRILQLIQKAFARLLPNVTWMDEETQQAAQRKLQHMTHMIGYPEWIYDVNKLDAYYEALNFSADLGLYDAHLSLNEFHVQKNLQKLQKNPDPTEWHMGPLTVNAYYDPSTNCMVFPAAILQPPFFDADAPLAFNLGTLGWVMGHELTHGFDSNGRDFDERGLLKSWWSEAAAKEYEKRSRCLKNQYSQYSVDGTALKGSVTLGENIADNGGLLLARQALRTEQSQGRGRATLPGLNLTSSQLFYTAAAQVWCSYYTPEYTATSLARDVHSYPKFRVTGAFSNQKEFATSFLCLRESSFNPKHRCALW